MSKINNTCIYTHTHFSSPKINKKIFSHLIFLKKMYIYTNILSKIVSYNFIGLLIIFKLHYILPTFYFTFYLITLLNVHIPQIFPIHNSANILSSTIITALPYSSKIYFTISPIHHRIQY